MIETKIAANRGMHGHDEVLAFLIEWIARRGIAPSFGDISREQKMSDMRAKQLVKKLVAQGKVEQIRAAFKASIRVRDVAGSRNQLEHMMSGLNT